MTAASLDPFQRIVGVGWGGRKILVLEFYVTENVKGPGATPPDAIYNVDVTVGANGPKDLLHNTWSVLRPDVHAEPPIEFFVTPAMLAGYAIWSYPTLVQKGPIGFNEGVPAFYFITCNGALYPDFVNKPYDSFASATAYIDAQAVIHPDYYAYLFYIQYSPAELPWSQQTTTWHAFTFINLDALGLDGDGNLNIDFHIYGENMDTASLAVAAMLYGVGTGFNFSVSEDYTERNFGSGFITGYDLHLNNT